MIRELKEPLPPFGPQYPALASVAKFRRAAHRGLKHLDRDERRRYGEAVGQAILALQRAEANRGFRTMPAKPNCASGTVFNTGEQIHKAIRAQQVASLMAYPAFVRRNRTDEEWASMYADAMRAKRRACELAPLSVC